MQQAYKFFSSFQCFCTKVKTNDEPSGLLATALMASTLSCFANGEVGDKLSSSILNQFVYQCNGYY